MVKWISHNFAEVAVQVRLLMGAPPAPMVKRISWKSSKLPVQVRFLVGAPTIFFCDFFSYVVVFSNRNLDGDTHQNRYKLMILGSL